MKSTGNVFSKQLGTLIVFTGCLVHHYLARDSIYLSDAAELSEKASSKLKG